MKRHLRFHSGSVYESVEVTDNRQDVVLSGGDQALYIPLKTKEFPLGVYARAGARGDSRVRVQPGGSYETLRLFRKVGLDRPWSTSYNNPGTYSWRVPYTLSYRITVKGAGGGASGAVFREHVGKQNDRTYLRAGARRGGSGASVAKVVSLRAGDTYTVRVGEGGSNGADAPSTHWADYRYAGGGTDGGSSSFGNEIIAGGGGGARLTWYKHRDDSGFSTNESGKDAGNGLGGRGGWVRIGQRRRWDDEYIEDRKSAEDGSVYIEAILS